MSSLLDATDPLPPGPPALLAAPVRALQRLIPGIFAGLRAAWPIAGLRGFYAVTGHDDVSEVFGCDADFDTPYRDNILALTDGQDFFLGLRDGPDYRAKLSAMRRVTAAGDLAALGDQAESLAEKLLAQAAGSVEVVSHVRAVTFGVMAPYFGIPPPETGRLEVWATRLFAFQFTGNKNAPAWAPTLQVIAPALRNHIDATIARRRAQGVFGEDVLGRCLSRQAAGEPGYSDIEIRTNLLCMVVGGPPQPPMVVPQAIEQLLRRPDALAAAQSAARADDDAKLHDIVFEAMRFDPLAPGLFRTAARDHIVADGTRRARKIASGSTVFVAFSSAMMDPRRISEPAAFRPGRPSHEYMHFGFGLHECFGEQINHATLHRMVKPLLRQPNLRRASGAEGHLRKRGVFAERLAVRFG
jgi:cytochrome P450